MWNPPTEKQLAKIPRLYSREEVPVEDKVLYMHFFIGGTDWWVAEYDPKEKLFFGYTVLNGDVDMAEWGYISLEELRSLHVGPIQVDRDLHFMPATFMTVMQDYSLARPELRAHNVKKEIAKEKAEHPQLSNKEAAVIVEQHEKKKRVDFVKKHAPKKAAAAGLIAEAQRIEEKRSPQSRESDERQENQELLPLTKENLEKWRSDPGAYDLKGIDTIKRIAKLFHALKKKKVTASPTLAKYDAKDLEAARSYLKQHKDLYEDGPHYIELQAEIAKLIHNGVDPAVIDFAAHLSEDASLSESLRNEMEFDLLEGRS